MHGQQNIKEKKGIHLLSSHLCANGGPDEGNRRYIFATFLCEGAQNCPPYLQACKTSCNTDTPGDLPYARPHTGSSEHQQSETSVQTYQLPALKSLHKADYHLMFRTTQ